MFDYLEMLTLALIPGFLLLDLLIQKRNYHKTRHWRLRGLLVTVAIFFFTGEVAVFWGEVFGDFHLFDSSGLGVFGAVVAIAVYELVHYGYHRAAHEWNWLWRAGHQMHHSAESLDAAVRMGRSAEDTGARAGDQMEMFQTGEFEIKTRKPRVGRNPNEPSHTVPIPERVVVKFKPGKVMREKVSVLDPALVQATSFSDDD